MREETKIEKEDIVPVRSRISWGAILGGSVLALSLYFLFTVLGAATGLSVGDTVSSSSMRIGAMVYAGVVSAVCLFVGGFYASRLTVGENGIEAAIYGVLVWAVVFGSLVFLAATGVRGGFQAVVGVAAATSRVAADPNAPNWEELARRAGVSSEQIGTWKQKANEAPQNAKQTIEDPQNQQAALDMAKRATWYSFFAGWISMMMAAAGGYCGSGANLRLLTTYGTRAKVVATPVVTRS